MGWLSIKRYPKYKNIEESKKKELLFKGYEIIKGSGINNRLHFSNYSMFGGVL